MRRSLSLSAFLVFVYFSKVSAQFPPGQQKAFLVKRMIELNHYSPRPVDDSFSLGLFKTMLNAADSRRLLFTAPEYKIISAYSFKLDDELLGNGWVFLELFINLYKRALTRADSVGTAVL